MTRRNIGGTRRRHSWQPSTPACETRNYGSKGYNGSSPERSVGNISLVSDISITKEMPRNANKRRSSFGDTHENFAELSFISTTRMNRKSTSTESLHSRTFPFIRILKNNAKTRHHSGDLGCFSLGQNHLLHEQDNRCARTNSISRRSFSRPSACLNRMSSESGMHGTP